MHRGQTTESSLAGDSTRGPSERSESRRASRKPRRTFLGILAHTGPALLAGILDLLLVGRLVAAAFVAISASDLPDPERLKQVQLEEPLRVYSADGGVWVRCLTRRYRTCW